MPEDWRVNNVSLFKKGCEKKRRNYRPVRLTPLVGKLLEKIQWDQISKHLDRQGSAMDSQHGFVGGKL